MSSLSGRIAVYPRSFAWSPSESQFFPSDLISPGPCSGRNNHESAVAASITSTAFTSSLPVR